MDANQSANAPNSAPIDPLRRGAVVLCGGGSVRMGRDKASLPFGPDETMLQRVVRLVGTAVPAENIVVVAAVDQTLPPLPAEIQVIHDALQGQGPLPALIAGLTELVDRCDAAFATGCDTPLLAPALIDRLFGILEDGNARRSRQAVIPGDVERLYPLSAIYTTQAIVALQQAVDEGGRSLHAAAARDDFSAQIVAVDELVSTRSGSQFTLLNCNTLAEYMAALKGGGCPLDDDAVDFT